MERWVQNSRPVNDYGAIILPTDAFSGQNLGRFGFAVFPSATLLAKQTVLAGCPGDKPFAELWGMARRDCPADSSMYAQVGTNTGKFRGVFRMVNIR